MILFSRKPKPILCRFRERQHYSTLDVLWKCPVSCENQRLFLIISSDRIDTLLTISWHAQAGWLCNRCIRQTDACQISRSCFVHSFREYFMSKVLPALSTSNWAAACSDPISFSTKHWYTPWSVFTSPKILSLGNSFVSFIFIRSFLPTYWPRQQSSR